MSDSIRQVAISVAEGSARCFDTPVTVMTIAQTMGPHVVKNTVAARANGRLMDLCDVIDSDASITWVAPEDEDGLHIIRHSCAHLLGHAVKQLYPTAKMVIGPVIEYGFYYDIAFERSFTPEDLAAIERRMGELIAQDYNAIKRQVSRAEASEIFTERGEAYKLRLIDEMPGESTLGLYHPKSGSYPVICSVGGDVGGPMTGAIRSLM